MVGSTDHNRLDFVGILAQLPDKRSQGRSLPLLMRRSSQDFSAGITRGVWALLLGIMSTLASCASVPEKPERVLLRRGQMHMGTLVTITAAARTEVAAQAAMTAGFQEIRRLEELLSTWIPTSDLSRVNQAAGREPVKVDQDTMVLLTRSQEVAGLTEGSFNVAIGPAVDAWGFYGRSRVPEASELAALRPLVDLEQVRLDPITRTVYLARPGMRIDVGGIGKGFAADLAAEAMKRAGAFGGVVALSGDMRTFGLAPDDTRYLFAIKHPRKEGAVLARVELQDEAISTAGDYERSFERNGVRYHHILDPRTLQPAQGCQSVTVVAREGVLADGLDTGIFVMGPRRGMELVEKLAGVEAVIVDREGNILISSGLKDRIQIVQ